MKLEYAKELSIEQNTLDLLSKANRALERVEAGTPIAQGLIRQQSYNNLGARYMRIITPRLSHAP
jgi:hypothetical protein